MGLFRKNKLNLEINKYNYLPGDFIEGSFTIDLKKYYEVREIRVSLIGRRKERHRDSDGQVDYRWVDVYNFTTPLAPEGKYQYQQFHFKIKIPSTILEQCDKPIAIDPNTTLGKIQGFARAMTTNRVYPVEWLVRAQLDIPYRFDFIKERKIVISN